MQCPLFISQYRGERQKEEKAEQGKRVERREMERGERGGRRGGEEKERSGGGRERGVEGRHVLQDAMAYTSRAPQRYLY